MSAHAVLFGPLGPPDATILRSGLRWLVPDGHDCPAGTPLAYCSIALAGDRSGAFAGETQDLQLVFVLPQPGRFRHGGAVARGGYLDRLPQIPWSADAALGAIEGASAPVAPRLLFLAGRRFSDSAEDRSGLLSGWHDRVRAWWGEEDFETILGAGTCEQNGLLRGDAGHFEELFSATSGAAHIVHWQDEPQVPCARTLIEQLDRPEADLTAIAADMAAGIASADGSAGSRDWLFLGALLNALGRNPLTETYHLLTRSAVKRVDAPPRTLLLSLNAEFPYLLRHRTLGYALNCHEYRLANLGPTLRGWLKSRFEMIPRTPDQLRGDYRALAARLGNTRLLVLNATSSQAYERVQNYRMLDPATMASLGSLRAKTLNLMLHDLAAQGCVSIIDQDLLGAGLGTRTHLPDGTHASGALNAAMRAELLAVVEERRRPETLTADHV